MKPKYEPSDVLVFNGKQYHSKFSKRQVGTVTGIDFIDGVYNYWMFIQTTYDTCHVDEHELEPATADDIKKLISKHKSNK